MSYLDNEIDARSTIDEEIEKIQKGASIEDFADNGETGQDEDDAGQQFLDFGDTLNNKIGGQKPTGSEIKIKAISRPIKGQLGDTSDNEVVTFLVTARLDTIATVYKRDGDGDVVEKTRRHSVTPITVLPVSPEQADKLLGIE